MSTNITMYNDQELPSLSLAWTDATGALIDFSSGWTFTVKLSRTTAPATTLYVKTSGITGSNGSTGSNLVIDWSTTDWAGLEAAVNGTSYYVNVTARRTSDTKDRYFKPDSPITLKLKAAPGTSAVSPSSYPVTVTAASVTLADTGNYFAATNVEDALAEVASVFRGPTVADLTYPSVWAHRGGASLRPEETEIAFDGALNEGIPVLDTDGRLLADGQVALFHDSTVDRTTTSTGNVASFRSSDVQQMVVDASSFISSGSANTRPMLLAEWFRKYGGQSVLTIEAKDTGSCAAIIATANRLKLPKKQLIIQSFTYADCLTAVAAGYPALYLVNALTSATPATLAADGVGYVGANSALTSGNIAPFTAAGIKVGAWTYDTRYEWATLQAAGVNFVWSNDPSWVAGTSGKGAADPFLSKVPWPGKINSNSVGAGWQNTADYGFTNSTTAAYGGTLQGWMGNLSTTSSYTITFQAAIDAVNGGDTTRWCSVLVGAIDDSVFTDSSVVGTYGYHCLFRANGVLGLYKIVNGTTTLLQQQTITAPTLGTKYTYKIAVTPTTVTFYRNDVPGTTCSTSDTAGGRNGYVWFGRNSASGRFSDVTVV